MTKSALILWGAGIVTVGLLGLCAWYSLTHLDAVYSLKPNEIGDTFAGLFAALAFTWLFAGILIQSEELKLQREEIKETRKTFEAQRQEMAAGTKQAKAQAEAVQANAKHAARDTFFRVLEIFEKDANSLLADFLLNARTTGLQYTNSNGVSAGTIDSLWQNYSNGNRYAFCTFAVTTYRIDIELLAHVSNQKDRIEKISKFRKTFEKILLECDLIDDESMTLRAAFEWSPMGEAYALFSCLKPTWFANFKKRSAKFVDDYRESLPKES